MTADPPGATPIRLTPWAELQKRYFNAKQIREARVEPRRGMVEFHRFHEDGPWIVFLRGPWGSTNVHARAQTIAAARRRARAEIVAVAGKSKSAALWRDRAETMPAGAEEFEASRLRRQRTEQRG